MEQKTIDCLIETFTERIRDLELEAFCEQRKIERLTKELEGMVENRVQVELGD